MASCVILLFPAAEITITDFSDIRGDAAQFEKCAKFTQPAICC